MAFWQGDRKKGKAWSVDVYLPNGKRYRKTVETKKQAEEVEKKITAEIVTGKWSLRCSDITSGELLPEYFEYYMASKAKPVFNTQANPIKPHKHWVLLFDVLTFD